MARKRILLDARAVQPLLANERIDAQILLLLALGRIDEFSLWMCSSQISTLLEETRGHDEADCPDRQKGLQGWPFCSQQGQQQRDGQRANRLVGLLDFTHIALAGESDVRAIYDTSEADLNVALVKRTALSHRALAVVSTCDSSALCRDAQQKESPAHAEAQSKINVLSAAGLFNLLNDRCGVSYALVTS